MIRLDAVNGMDCMVPYTRRIERSRAGAIVFVFEDMRSQFAVLIQGWVEPRI